MMHKETGSRMFTGALFVIAKNQKQSKYPSKGEWIHIMQYIITKEYYKVAKKKEPNI